MFSREWIECGQHDQGTGTDPIVLHSPLHTSIAVIGGGLTGMATAARLAARNRQVTVFESHRTVGGCSGYFRRRGFAFDVGSTTMVDYGPDGVGGQMLAEIGISNSILEHLPGYLAWLPGNTIELHSDPARWRVERARALGDTPNHRKLWLLLDSVARAFWHASRRGPRMPIQSVRDLALAASVLPIREWPLLRYLNWTLDDAVKWAGLSHDSRLRAFMSMVVQDTVHADPAAAPLINASLGLSIRGAIARPRGGMYGFWNAFEARASELGVKVHLATPVESVSRSDRGERGRFCLRTSRGEYTADAIVCTLPIWDAAKIGTEEVKAALRPWCHRDEGALGGAGILTMGVPESELTGHAFTHHQFLPEPEAPLGSGNNCFLSASSAGDTLSAPDGYRAVMLTTHVEIDGWSEMTPETHAQAKQELGNRMLRIAQTAYPRLGEQAQWLAVASPRTYAKFTRRHRGSVGGTRLTLLNSNQRAVPHNIGVAGWVQAGDTTWPGLGTTACAMCSKIAADDVCSIV